MRSLLDHLLSPRILRPLFWVLAAIALTMALLPRPPVTPFDRFGDKFEHMLAFAALAGVSAFAWPRLRARRLLLALSGFGAAIEVLQAIPALHRDSDWHDWVADTLAAIIALALARWLAALLARS